MNGVLIVDDDSETRDRLVHDLVLSKNYSKVVGVATGEEAVKTTLLNPQDFRFAVVDHILPGGMDGIETTRELVRVCPTLYPVVFSNIRNDAKLKEYKFKALQAGAYRYLEKRDDGPRQISEFVQEMEQLEQLRNRIAAFQEARTVAPSLLTQLDIGTDIIDSHYKVWFMNDAMRKITGFVGHGLPKGPCCEWHGFTWYPCDGCLVCDSFEHGASRSDVFLLPMVYRQDKVRELFYLKIWSQSLNEPFSALKIGEKKAPLAVMESVLDLTESAELKAMPLEERLGIIARSACALKQRDYSPFRLFEYVRIYVGGQGGTAPFVLRAAAGKRRPAQCGHAVNLRAVDGRRLSDAEGHTRHTGYGYWFEHADGFDPVMPGETRIPYIYWPIIYDGVTIALIEAGGSDLKRDSSAKLSPYAKEVLEALKDDHARNAASVTTVEAAKLVGDVDLKLQTEPRTAEEQLRYIVERACELTDSFQYVLRYRDGEEAKLLKLDIPNLSDYEKLASLSYPLSCSESWSCRTILAGTETLANTAEHFDSVQAFRAKLKPSENQTFKEVNSICCEPLILEGFCIGAIAFHAKTVPNYDEKKRAILRLLAKRAAWALQDYLMARAIRERAEADTLAGILGVVLHNIKTPLASIQLAFDQLLSNPENTIPKTPDAEELVNTINTEVLKISHLQQAVVRLRKPWESRVEKATLHDLIQKIDARRIQEEKVKVEYHLEGRLNLLNIDAAAVEICLEILIDNAIDALKDKRSKRITIVLRDAEPPARQGERSHGKLAIDVVDNGKGVRSDIAARLFTTLQSEKASGTGIGLIHCRAIARSAHGDVFHDSSHSGGAKFTLTLPYTTQGK